MPRKKARAAIVEPDDLPGIEPEGSICPIEFRYPGRPSALYRKLAEHLSERALLKYRARVEVALMRVLVEDGVAPARALAEIERAAKEIDPREVREEEKKTEHDVRALVNCLARRMSPAYRRFVHLFATSYDIVDTARALATREAVQGVLLPALTLVERELLSLARAHAGQPQIGRTHGRHAVPTTFGYALALYVGRLGNRILSIRWAAENLRGKFSGAVGAYNALRLHPGGIDPAGFERRVLAHLGLRPSEAQTSSQVVQPEFLADLMHALLSTFGVLANLADDLRHLMRSEIEEVVEGVTEERVGSSTMPHKVNPKNFENIKSLWKAFVPRMLTVYLDQISEHQRDLTNSASQRFGTEILVGLSAAAERMAHTLAGLRVNPERMRKHLEAAAPQFAAEPLYILLALYTDLENPHEAVRKLSAVAREQGISVLEAARKDPILRKALERIPPEAQEILEDPLQYLGSARERTLAACDYWENAIANLR